MKKVGFSLIEVMVVVVILGILATISYAAGINYQKSARDSVRKKDLRDVQIALKMYYDNKGHYPMQDIEAVLKGFIFGCEDYITMISPGQVWACTDDENPVTYMKIYPNDPKPWKPEWWGPASDLNYVYLPTTNFGDTSDYCFGVLTCQGYRLYACLENVNDKSATGPAGGIIQQFNGADLKCNSDRAPLLVSPE